MLLLNFLQNFHNQLLSSILSVFNIQNLSSLKISTYATLRSYFRYAFKPPFFTGGLSDFCEGTSRIIIDQYSNGILLKSAYENFVENSREACTGCGGCSDCGCPQSTTNGDRPGVAFCSGASKVVAIFNLEEHTNNFRSEPVCGSQCCPSSEQPGILVACPEPGQQIPCGTCNCLCVPGGGCSCNFISGTANLPELEYFNTTVPIWAEQNEIIPGCTTSLCTAIPYKNIKVNINNQDMCIPIICDSGCEEFELCE